MLLLSVCLADGCGVCLGRKILRTERIESVLTRKQLEDLADWSVSPDSAKYLLAIERQYFAMRKRWGFNS